jgi:hypothetical protein
VGEVAFVAVIQDVARRASYPEEPPRSGPISERSGSADVALSEKSPYLQRCVGEVAFLAVIQDVARGASDSEEPLR